MICLLTSTALLSCEGSTGETEIGRQGLASTTGFVALAELGSAPFRPAEVFLEAPWGTVHDAVSREEGSARTGPMAIAAEPDGGVAILDTVGGRVLRYDGRGELRSSVAIGVETADDLVVLPDRSLAALVYHREPSPGHEVISFGADGAARQRFASPQGATMPTALLVDGATIGVESRHEAVHPVDGSARLWGRPAGDLLLRAQLVEGGLAVLTARDRSGQPLWERAIDLATPVAEILELQACDRYVALVIRGIGPSDHETFLVAFTRDGTPLGQVGLLDRRVTDAVRPFAVGRSGDLFELATSDDGATVLRYRYEEGDR